MKCRHCKCWTLNAQRASVTFRVRCPFPSAASDVFAMTDTVSAAPPPPPRCPVLFRQPAAAARTATAHTCRVVHAAPPVRGMCGTGVARDAPELTRRRPVQIQTDRLHQLRDVRPTRVLLPRSLMHAAVEDHVARRRSRGEDHVALDRTRRQHTPGGSAVGGALIAR